MRPRRPPAWWVALVALATVAGAAAAFRWSDGEYLRLMPPDGYPPAESTGRPAWLVAYRFPCERAMNAAPVAAGVVTLGAALLLAGAGRFRPRRGRLGPGALATLATALLGGALTIHVLAARPGYQFNRGIAQGLTDFWNYHMPGLALGAWVVAARRGGRRWRRDPLDRVARVVPWLWLVEPLLLAAHGLIFG